MEPASPQEASLWRLCRSGYCGANSWLSAKRLGIPRGTFPAQQPEPRRRGEERDEGAGRAAGRSSKRQRPPQPSSAAGKAGEPGLWRAKRCPRVGGTEPGAPATITQRGSEGAPGTRLRRDESVGRRETLRGRPQPLPPPPQRSVTPLPGASPSTRAHRRGCASFGPCLPKQVPTGRSRSPRSRCSWSASPAGLPGSQLRLRGSAAGGRGAGKEFWRAEFPFFASGSASSALCLERPAGNSGGLAFSNAGNKLCFYPASPARHATRSACNTTPGSVSWSYWLAACARAGLPSLLPRFLCYYRHPALARRACAYRPAALKSSPFFSECRRDLRFLLTHRLYRQEKELVERDGQRTADSGKKAFLKTSGFLLCLHNERDT
uniref:uncharacterized protein LOC114595463 n=1 Tax=Podarcis muralis TaxID=64176 RepID=UPI0010A06900|nr:uncharacterized protein LOC114595463 [Podarcis muralis]